MIVKLEYHPISDPTKLCVIALCDDPEHEIAKTSKRFFEYAGCPTDEPNWGKFVYRIPTKRDESKFHTPGDAFIFVACEKISVGVLELANKRAEAYLKLGACYEDYIRMCDKIKNALIERTPEHVDVGYEEVLGEIEAYLEDDGGDPPYTLSWVGIDLSSIEGLPEGTLFKPGDKLEIIARKIG